MITPLQAAKILVNQKTLDFRALTRIVTGDLFERAIALDPNNPDLNLALQDANVEWVREWIKITLKDLTALSMTELRNRARQEGIPHIHTLTKDQLILEISNASGLRKATENTVKMPDKSEERPGIQIFTGSRLDLSYSSSGGRSGETSHVRVVETPNTDSLDRPIQKGE